MAKKAKRTTAKLSVRDLKPRKNVKGGAPIDKNVVDGESSDKGHVKQID